MTHEQLCQALRSISDSEAWSAPADCVSVEDRRFQWLAESDKPSQATVEETVARGEIMAQIVALEQRELAPRFSREGLMGLVLNAYISQHPTLTLPEAVANLTNPEHADYNGGFTKLKALDDSIRALRAKL